MFFFAADLKNYNLSGEEIHKSSPKLDRSGQEKNAKSQLPISKTQKENQQIEKCNLIALLILKN